MQDQNGQLTAGGKLLAGLGAGICEAVLAVTPMETVKVKFINDQRSANPQFKGFFHGVRTIVAQEGLLGCYKGVTATIIKQGTQINEIKIQKYNELIIYLKKKKSRLKSSNSFLCHGNTQRFI